MKKLRKIKLHNAVVLEEREMKTIYGGSGGSDTCVISCKEGTRDHNVKVSSCYDEVWPCGSGNGWNCSGC